LKTISITTELHDWMTVRRGSHETFDSLLRKKLGLAARTSKRGPVYPVAALAVGQSITLPHSTGLIIALKKARRIQGRMYRRWNGPSGVCIIRIE